MTGAPFGPAFLLDAREGFAHGAARCAEAADQIGFRDDVRQPVRQPQRGNAQIQRVITRGGEFSGRGAELVGAARQKIAAVGFVADHADACEMGQRSLHRIVRGADLARQLQFGQMVSGGTVVASRQRNDFPGDALLQRGQR